MRERGEIVELRLPAFARDPIGLLRRRWVAMAIVGAVVLVASAAAIRLRFMPQFKATATVIVSSQQIREDFVRSAVANGAFDKISVMVGETLSNERLHALVEELNLYPDLRTLLPAADVVAILRKSIAIAAQESVGPQPHFETAGLFTISVRYDTPDQAAAAANALATTFADAGVRLRLRQAQLATQLLRDRQQFQAEALAERERAATAFRAQHRPDLALGTTDQLEEQLALLRARLAREQAAYTDRHPNIRALQRELGGLSGQLGAVHARREELKALEREATIARRLYHESVARVKEAELSERLEVSEGEGIAAVLDRAVPPLRPERTRRELLILAALAALGAAGLTGVLLELRDPIVIAADQLDDTFGLDVLGGVPAIR